jgi:hypothetical protein
MGATAAQRKYDEKIKFKQILKGGVLMLDCRRTVDRLGLNAVKCYYVNKKRKIATLLALLYIKQNYSTKLLPHSLISFRNNASILKTDKFYQVLTKG